MKKMILGGMAVWLAALGVYGWLPNLVAGRGVAPIPAVAFPFGPLRAAEYNSAARRLTVAFRSGHVYVYENVSAGVFLALRLAPSPGGYFNRRIRGRFPIAVRPEAAQP